MNKNTPKLHIRVTSLILTIVFVYQLFFPTIIVAQSGGSGQAENKSFIPAGASDMVNLFTGDLNYSIPLLDIEGYPVTLSYDGNVGMETEASWVGLGWSCSPGFINREKRGLPDDFNNDVITQQTNLKTEQEFKFGSGSYRTWVSFIPIIGASWSWTKEKELHFVASAYEQGSGYEKNLLNTNTAGDYFSMNGKTEAWTFNTFKGHSYRKTFFNKNNDFPLLPSMMSATTKSRTLFYNSDAGLTHMHRGVGTSSEFSMGYTGIAVDVVLTLLSFGAFGAVKEGKNLTQLGKVSQIANLVTMVQPSMSFSSNGGSVITTGTPTYTPAISIETLRQSKMTQNRLGDNFLIYSKGNSFSFKETNLPVINTTKQLPTKGFLNSSNWWYDSQIAPLNLNDMNRENDGVFYETMQNLPVTNATYDVYHVRGDGMVGDFRAFRNDVGTYDVPLLKNEGNGTGKVKSKVKGRIISSYTKTTTNSTNKTTSGVAKWENPGNYAPQQMKFTTGVGMPDYEPYYFKNIGEKVSYNKDFYDLYGGDQPAQAKFSYYPYSYTYNFSQSIPPFGNFNFDIVFPQPPVGTQAKLDVKNTDGTYSEINLPDSRSLSTLKDKREYRNELFIEKKAGEAEENFVDEKIRSYQMYPPSSDGTITPDFSLDRTTHPNHHTSEIVVQTDKGGKYVYGIPVYNYEEKNATFNVTGRSPAPAAEELVEYVPGDNSLSNTRGYENYFHSTSVPQYASSFLLTSIINDDYIDLQGDGPTEDDYGNYTKFNYSRAYNDYHWRTPYKVNRANYSTVHHAYDDDEKGSYTYGKKDIWYVHSIESKNYIAEFYLSDREDAFSVLGENGGKDATKPLKKLDKIKLFAKEDRMKNGADAVPIKTVHLEYDYSLCQGIPANPSGGKLTLKEVYFTYGNSDKGKYSKYKFNYADFDNDGTQDVNDSYSPNSVDRWGDYKPNNATLLNSEYPFVAQNNRSQADEYAAAWRLSNIITPEGAKIDVYYEANDYAYVQNKRAMQMFKIKGVGSDATFAGNNTLYSGLNDSKDYIYFELQENLSGTLSLSDAKDYLAANYFKDIQHLYFKSMVELSPNSGVEEYVEGYAKINDFGVVDEGGSPYQYGWIKLDPAFYNGHNPSSNTNPISKAGWQALRTQVPRAYRSFSNWGYDFLALNYVRSGAANSNNLYKRRSLAQSIDLNKSWIRLVNPTQKKIGGGARVKKVIVTDNWGNMGGSTSETYGKIYNYEIEENGRIISSGVAAYEPFVGNEENPWKTPEFFIKHNQNFPSDYLYQETPFGESHFPGPVVGYSSVKTSNIEQTGVTENATGYTINKFYTSKDFPTIIDKTIKQVKKIISTPSDKELIKGVPTVNFSFASQGFVVIKNDMHGKEKGTEVYNEGENLLSKSTIHYKADLINGNTYKLNNNATIINKDGTTEEVVIGKDIDVYSAYRESFDTEYSTSVTDGREYSLFSLFGVLGKIKSSSVTNSSKRLYTTVLTKVINQYGLVDRVETEELGTKKTLRNIAYDGETGNILLTAIKNEYDDEIYNFQYPAHWHYDNLGQAYKNTAIYLSGLSSPLTPHNGIVSLDATSVNYFTKGDNLLVTYGSTPTTVEAWVLEVDKTISAENITCIDENGVLIPFTADPIAIKIMESGRKNMQNLPIGTVVSLSNPITTGTLQFTNVIQSSAVEFSEEWTTVCQPLTIDIQGYPYASESYALPTPGVQVNPYTKGIKGKWRLKKSYSYNQDRLLTSTASASDIRDDGTYTSFMPFWDFNTSGKLVPIYDVTYPSTPGNLENWKVNSEVTRYGKDGNILETKDILDRHAATLYGYSPTFKNVPVAIASNTEQKQMMSDGFEDYEYLDAVANQLNIPGHFNFNNASGGIIDSNEAHTGMKSLRVEQGVTHYMGKAIRENCEEEEGGPYEGNNFLIQHCDCEQQFSPTPGKYVLSAWTRQIFPIPGTPVADAVIKVRQFDATHAEIIPTTVISPLGFVIEGWQRMEGVVDIDASTAFIIIELVNDGTAEAPDVYFDDVRMHPFKSAMKTMVYDGANLRLMSELDNQNYATFFEYDEEGTLVRIKKETEKGIVTIKETRSSIVKE
tara:strand:- start:9990 stop:16232 length:6243 start_codon:yes stop_codon:yes gene_type:complete